jgi:hypothetical protein
VQGGNLVNDRRLFGIVASAILAWAATAAAALGENASMADGRLAGNEEKSPPSFFQPAVDQSPCAAPYDADFGQPRQCPRWTASADFIILDRIGGVNQSLVSTYPPHSPIVLGSGTERLNSNDLEQGFAGGTRVGLIRHGDSGYDLEFSFFEIDGWNSAGSIAPDGSMLPNWLVFTAPGDFVQTTDDPKQSMAWEYAAKLYNAEINLRWNLCSRVTMLAGFRWVNLCEDLQGTIVPSKRKSPFWDTGTTNNLYGFQLGEDWKIVDRGRFSIDGLVKAGIFGNNAEETTGVSIYRTVYWESDSTARAAFLGEIGLQCKYQVAKRFLLKAGYEAIWLQGVALAPAQIPETLSHGSRPIHVQALGVDSGSGVFFHGATVGLEYSF